MCNVDVFVNHGGSSVKLLQYFLKSNLTMHTQMFSGTLQGALNPQTTKVSLTSMLSVISALLHSQKRNVTGIVVEVLRLMVPTVLQCLNMHPSEVN